MTQQTLLPRPTVDDILDHLRRRIDFRGKREWEADRDKCPRAVWMEAAVAHELQVVVSWITGIDEENAKRATPPSTSPAG